MQLNANPAFSFSPASKLSGDTMTFKMIVPVFLLIATFALAGCGSGHSSCELSIGVDPQTAQADHAAVAPGNQARFLATSNPSGPGCPTVVTQLGNVNATWTTSDTVSTSITSVRTTIGTDGVATCVNATATPATITATSSDGLKATATLSCR
jgi:hypothetical protein